MDKPRVLICGGRDAGATRQEYEYYYRQIDAVIYGEYPYEYLPDIVIISGCARGADQLAIDYAVVNWTELLEFPADWDKYGKGAGYIRNKQMLDEGKPDLVIALPGGTGTANMVKQAEKAGVKVIHIDKESL